MTRYLKAAVTVMAVVVAAGLCGCSYLASSLTRNFQNHLSSAVLDSNDPDTVAAALPSYLLTLDALVMDSDSAGLYWTAAKLNSAYAGQFAQQPEQKKRLADKAWVYAQKAACLEDDRWCTDKGMDLTGMTPDALATLLQKTERKQVALLFNLGSVWATWLDANHDDWNAVAQLGKVDMIMQRVIVLDETHELASAHVYLGVLDTLMPAALGGKPEEGKQHFERAIQLSGGRNLMAKVLYAERYARLVFDRELHDRLLKEVIAADNRQPGWTLANTLAQAKAKQLLASANDYF